MEELLEQLWSELVGELRAQAEEYGVSIGEAAEDVAAYAAVRTQALANAVGEPGFSDIVLAERDNVALRAGLRAVQEGEVLDARIDAALTFALRALAGLVAKAV